ncbi:Gfo/Idh/MocA family oxidoreductase [Flavihumibacter stibioxidans]|uniref:Oxidoreductase n=1 Tax=Flavihumibacter stibioxidans TaxID=1834163 RepID=A0ABR7M8A7_9BACT|nr:Gfo/Idh/MocA family oxidoreductase [Flavihumibacter stibioxidans]MBC6491268.1 oxidoreductase [Flavihumibacter stibioxidans]
MSIIKTGICSYGMSGKLFHAPFIQNHPGFELAAIVERHKTESRERYPQSALVRSFEELLKDDTLQLIVVNTPVQTHFEYVKAALEAGKNVVAEKPFTVNAAEAGKLEALAAKKNLLLTVYQNRRYDGDFRALKKVVQENQLGDIREVEFRYERYRVQPSGKEHKEGALPGAGILHDLGAHLVDQSLQLFGWPEAVFADIWTMREQVAANDYFELLLYYPRMRVRLKATVVARETPPAFILHGMKGSFLQERSDLQEAQLLAGVEPSIESWCAPAGKPDGLLHTTIDGKDIREETWSKPGNYMGFYDDVWKALTGIGPNPVPAGDAVKSMKIIDAALESMAKQSVIRLNPLK